MTENNSNKKISILLVKYYYYMGQIIGGGHKGNSTIPSVGTETKNFLALSHNPSSNIM